MVVGREAQRGGAVNGLTRTPVIDAEIVDDTTLALIADADVTLYKSLHNIEIDINLKKH